MIGAAECRFLALQQRAPRSADAAPHTAYRKQKRDSRTDNKEIEGPEVTRLDRRSTSTLEDRAGALRKQHTLGGVGIRTVLVGDDLPELGADLVAALAALHVDDLAHCRGVGKC
jgi:hypothetical protein